MTEIFLIIASVASICSLVLILVLIKRKPEDVSSTLKDQFSALEKIQVQADQMVKDEIARNRQETAVSTKILAHSSCFGSIVPRCS